MWRGTDRGEDEVKTLEDVVKKVVHIPVKDIKGKDCVALGRGMWIQGP